MTHVLEVIHALQPGGAEEALRQRLNHQPTGFRTTVLTMAEVEGHAAAALRSAGIDVVTRALGWTDRRWWRSFTEATAPDVVVTHSPGDTTKLLTWQRRDSRPLVVVAHHAVVSDNPRNRKGKEWTLRVLNPRAQLHIAVSRTAAMGAQCAGARRIAVHPLGAEIAEADPDFSAWPPETRMRLMTLSRLIWFKNIPQLIAAVATQRAALRSAGAHLTVVGSGPQRAEIARAIRELSVADLVSMHDHVDDPAALLRAADAFISCATSEGGPLTVFEASLAGARVMATPTGVAPDVLAHDLDSVLTAGADPEQLGCGLRALVERGPLGNAEREHRAQVAQQWTSAARAPGFYSLLESAVSERRRVP